jgi:K+-sensing histidine kinase KdpD
MEDRQSREILAQVRRIHHDANSPLTAALGHVQLLMEEPAAQAAEVQEALRIVENELHRLIRVLARLRELGQ